MSFSCTEQIAEMLSMPQSRSKLGKVRFSRVKHLVRARDVVAACGTGVFYHEARLAFQDRVFSVASATREAAGGTNLDATEE
jgi:hypothetical protein